MTCRRIWALILIMISCSSCGGQQSQEMEARGGETGKGVTHVDPGSPVLSESVPAGQTIYVPAYSAIATGDTFLLYQLAITLSVRNTDREHPIVLRSVRYHHRDGQLVRELLKTPLSIAPLAATEFLVSERDTSGGTASSFLVEWVATQTVSDPIVETLMVGTSGTQGISFQGTSRILADRSRSREAITPPGLPSPAPEAPRSVP